LAGGGEAASCADERALEGAWGAADAEALAGAIRGTELAYAEETWSKVHVLLDTYAAAWQGLRRSSCEAHRSGAISSDLLDRRATCLDQRRADLRLVVDALREGDPATTERAVELILGLPAI